MGFSPRRRARFYTGSFSSGLDGFKKHAHLCGGRPILGSPGLSSGGSRPPSESLPAPKSTPKALLGRSLGRLGCLLEAPGPPWGGLPAPKGTPTSLQGRGQYEASDPKLKQTKASTMELHNTLPQGIWCSRGRGGMCKAKTICFPSLLSKFACQICVKYASRSAFPMLHPNFSNTLQNMPVKYGF
jgi:hypothetical protein